MIWSFALLQADRRAYLDRMRHLKMKYHLPNSTKTAKESTSDNSRSSIWTQAWLRIQIGGTTSIRGVDASLYSRKRAISRTACRWSKKWRWTMGTWDRLARLIQSQTSPWTSSTPRRAINWTWTNNWPYQTSNKPSLNRASTKSSLYSSYRCARKCKRAPSKRKRNIRGIRERKRRKLPALISSRFRPRNSHISQARTR